MRREPPEKSHILAAFLLSHPLCLLSTSIMSRQACFLEEQLLLCPQSSVLTWVSPSTEANIKGESGLSINFLAALAPQVSLPLTPISQTVNVSGLRPSRWGRQPSESTTFYQTTLSCHVQKVFPCNYYQQHFTNQETENCDLYNLHILEPGYESIVI